LLAALHARLSRWPEADPVEIAAPARWDDDLRDDELDAWGAKAALALGPRHPVHGDFHPGNVALGADGAPTAVFDWDNAYVGWAAQEAVTAAWEWAGQPQRPSRRLLDHFLSQYVAARGTEPSLTDGDLSRLLRLSLRWQIQHGRAGRH